MPRFNTHATTTAGFATAAAIDRATTRSPLKAFTLHVIEMLVAMFAGMVVLGGVVEGALAVAGASLMDAPAAVAATVMAFNMTAPMVWWMHHRGHPARHNVEMAASMIVPTVIVIVLHWLGAVSTHGVMAVQHAVMIPAMVGVMLWRYEHYAR
jgi:hypothetical protein